MKFDFCLQAVINFTLRNKTKTNYGKTKRTTGWFGSCSTSID